MAEEILPIAPCFLLMAQSIASLFAARLAELEEQNKESERKTAETLSRVRALVSSLEALNLEE